MHRPHVWATIAYKKQCNGKPLLKIDKNEETEKEQAKKCTPDRIG